MASSKSLDEYILIVTLLRDVFDAHGAEFSCKARRNTEKYVLRRLSSEGIGFLTKTLPRLGKALDKALTGNTTLNASELRVKPLLGSQLPRFLGELFQRVFTPGGTVLPDPCPNCVRSIRAVCYLLGKYELPYSADEEQNVIDRFKQTEQHICSTTDPELAEIANALDRIQPHERVSKTLTPVAVARRARHFISGALSGFDPYDIIPSHGPGAVATRQQLWEKYEWTCISDQITTEYPLDAYFYASLGSFCDNLHTINGLKTESHPARFILVPKDSRGPRGISCEPVDKQWIQQGLSKALVDHLESRPLTRYAIHFTDQRPNQIGALLGSSTGKYATLDLNEASDRITLSLVRLLYPPHIVKCLEACRTSVTKLPNGELLPLRKFAPMGSALCFPILALTVWALLAAAANDTDVREHILVYGDDVIVPTAFAEDAMRILESFGLKINRDKSCTAGFFRESCGVDAFKGIDVTPVRIRTPWSSSRSPNVYTSWIAYANSMWDRGYYATYDYIVGALHHVYGAIPSKDMFLTCPSLAYVPEHNRPKRRRVNFNLQKLEYHVYDVSSPVIKHSMSGWSMLLRYFTEGARASRVTRAEQRGASLTNDTPFQVSTYTRRDTSMLVKRWR